MQFPLTKTKDEYYAKIAKSYNALHKQEQTNKLYMIKKQGPYNGLILDLGSGTCISNKFFKDIICLDTSLEMLKQGKGLRVCGSAEHIPFKDKIFDSILSVTVLHHVDMDICIKEIKRVSKNTSKYSFSILKKSKEINMLREILHNNFKLKEINERKDLILVSR